MAFVVKDRVKETSATSGTGALTLAGAVSGFQAFSAVMATNDTCEYCIADGTAGAWEVGFGTYSGTNTLTRTAVYNSSNSGSAVSLAGNATTEVFIVMPAAKALPFSVMGGTTLKTGRYYSPPGTTVSSSTGTSGKTLYYPFFVPNRITATSLAVAYQSGITATIRLGIYSDNDGAPYSKLAENSGTIPATSAGALSVSVSQVMTPGLYWLAAQSSAAAQYTCYNDGQTLHNGILGNSTAALAISQNRVAYKTTDSASLPTTTSSPALEEGVGLIRVCIGF